MTTFLFCRALLPHCSALKPSSEEEETHSVLHSQSKNCVYGLPGRHRTKSHYSVLNPAWSRRMRSPLIIQFFSILSRLLLSHAHFVPGSSCPKALHCSVVKPSLEEEETHLLFLFRLAAFLLRLISAGLKLPESITLFGRQAQLGGGGNSYFSLYPHGHKNRDKSRPGKVTTYLTVRSTSPALRGRETFIFIFF